MDAATASGGQDVRLADPPPAVATRLPAGVHSSAAEAAPAPGPDLRLPATVPDQPPLGNRDFRVFLVGEGISALGDAISFTALPLLVLALTGSGLAMGILGALQMLPDLFIGMLAGVVADRADRRRIMLLANVGRAGLAALIPLTVLLDGPTLVVVMLVAAPISIMRSFFLAAYTGAIPTIVGRSHVAAATSYLEVVYSVGYIIGPAAAGILVAVIGPGQTIAIDAASFLLSAFAISAVRTDLRSARVDRPLDLLGEIRVGVDFIRNHPILRSTILLWGTFCVIAAGNFTALTIRITRDLGRSTAELGLLYSVFGVGTVASALLMSRIRRGHARWLLLGGIAMQGAALGLAAIVSPTEGLAALTLLAGFGGSMVLISYITVRTAYSPDELLGRIGATARVLSLGMQPVGMVVTGALIDLSNGSVTLIVMAAILFALCLAALPSRSLRAAVLNPMARSG